MENQTHPKAIRRRLLEFLYERYLENPLEMVAPEDILAQAVTDRKAMLSSMHYLFDRHLVELMLGYAPPMFIAARITPDGIDLVENRYAFNLRFPGDPGEQEHAVAAMIDWVERLVEEVDYSSLDGEARHSAQRDVQYLRDEIARPAHRWRIDVIRQVLVWIGKTTADPETAFPSWRPLHACIESLWRAEGPHAECSTPPA